MYVYWDISEEMYLVWQVDNVSSLSFPQNSSSNNEVQADIRDGKMVLH